MLNGDMVVQTSEELDKNNMTETEEKLSTDLIELMRTTRSGSSTVAIINSDGQDLVCTCMFTCIKVTIPIEYRPYSTRDH
jgi:hypothetical protein